MGYLFLVLALILNAGANVLLKMGAARLGRLDEPGLILRVATDWHLLAGLLLFALNIVFYTLALTRLNLSLAYPIMVAGGLIIVVSASVLVLRESLSISQMVGLVLLVAGIGLVGQRALG